MAYPDNAFEQLETRDVSQIAALDLGSNSFHLVVARVVAGSVQIVHKVKQKVRLADGLDDQSVLSQDAMQRGLAMLTLVAESLRGFAPDKVRIVATYTLRKAINCHEFLVAARKVLPYPIEVIPGIEEARLIYLGVAHTNHLEGKTLVVDIGGGSTEFAIGEGFDPLVLRSLEMGCVSYTKAFFNKGSISQKAFKQAVMAAEQELELIEKRYIATGWKMCLGTSGTIKCISEAIRLNGIAGQDSGLTLDALLQLRDRLINAGSAEAIDLLGISHERKAVIAAGLAILIAIFERLALQGMEYSSAALREGVLYEMEETLGRHSSIRQRSAESLATRYDVDTEQAKRVLATAMALFDNVSEAWKLTSSDLKAMLGWAALLHEVGLQINSRGVQRHSGYILQHCEMPGFNQEQQWILALLASMHRNKIKLTSVPELDVYEWRDVSRLVPLLRLAVLLNIKRQDDALPQQWKLTADDNQLFLTLDEAWLRERPIMVADLQREQQQIRALDLSLVINQYNELMVD